MDPTVNFSIQSRQVQFAIPTELIKKNLKSIQKLVEKLKKQTAEEVAAIKKNPQLSAEQKLQHVRKLIRNYETFQKKLKAAVQKDEDYRQRLAHRGKHLAKLSEFAIAKTDDDQVLDLHNEKLISWFRQEANLLIVDYLLKSNTRRDTNLGRQLMDGLASTFDDVLLDKLIDADVYESFNRVYISIEDHDLEPILAWYNENKNALKKFGSNLQFEIHYCRYLLIIELGSVAEAIAYCKLHLAPYANRSHYTDDDLINFDSNLKRLTKVGAPLVYASLRLGSKPSVLNNSLAEERWRGLSQCFTDDFTRIFAIPKTYPLLIYLAAGLSSLKTKSCYCNKENTIFGPHQPDKLFAPARNLPLRGPNYYYRILKKINQCPVCLPELFQLAQSLPYAQLLTSIFNNPFKLPNGNIYPFDKLVDSDNSAHNDLFRQGKLLDPLTQETFLIDDCVRVYPA